MNFTKIVLGIVSVILIVMLSASASAYHMTCIGCNAQEISDFSENTDIEMQEIIDQLFGSSNPNYSPSGKMIVRIVELEELDKYFKD